MMPLCDSDAATEYERLFADTEKNTEAINDLMPQLTLSATNKYIQLCQRLAHDLVASPNRTTSRHQQTVAAPRHTRTRTHEAEQSRMVGGESNTGLNEYKLPIAFFYHHIVLCYC
jgi:hypothetical protein